MKQVGAVAIGKNEGERLKACLRSLKEQVPHVVYVDSGSTDGSVEFARSLGVEVVELDTSVPFTAARARNAGFTQLLERAPGLSYVQFIDGDCNLVPHWIEKAQEFLAENPSHGVACGRRRERRPTASVYNYLCDVEWDTPVGDADACGGDALMRVEAFQAVEGFRSTMIAGEEPELGVRLRQAGWKIRRLDAEMTLHDAAMTRFSQWWKRATRAGHAFAEGAALHGAPPTRHWVAESRRSVFWGLVLPMLMLGSALVSKHLAAIIALAYPLNVIRIALRIKSEGSDRPWTIAFFLMLEKFPEALGWLRFQWGRIAGTRSDLIQYK